MEAVFFIATHLVDKFALRRPQPRAPTASARAANLDFDDLSLILLFDNFKVSEATQVIRLTGNE